jgi:hypothetical protein
MDYHGVITAAPDFFARFNALALAGGCEVYVLSGGSRQDILKDLNNRKIGFSYIWSLVDYFDNQHVVERYQNGTFKVDDTLWNQAKAHYCVRHGIDFYLDDSMLYGKYFETLFCLYDHQNARCFLGKEIPEQIDFTQPPEIVLKQILDLIAQKRG